MSVSKPPFIATVNAIAEKGRAGESLSVDERRLLVDYSNKRHMRESELSKRGDRYRQCRFYNYRVNCEQQQNAVDSLREYGNSEIPIQEGKSVILFGPKGTGKDHLLSALENQVFQLHGLIVRWFNGCDIHKFLKREAFGELSWQEEEKHPRDAEILYISDPLPPSGALTEYQMALFFDLIDYRYRNYAPTWISMNVLNGEDAENRMGAQTVDRLRDGALVLHCNWRSYRAAETIQ